MGLLLAGLPAVILWLVILPSTRRMALLRGRIAAAHERGREARPFTPVSREERAFLLDPGAPWRSRLPWIADDGARLAQVDRVVTEVNAALAAKGVKATAMKVLLDPVNGGFSLPAGLTHSPGPPRASSDAPEFQVGGWVLEVEIGGPTGELFKALAALATVNPLLEPVGLRWEVAAGPDGGVAEQHQVLRLRNLYLKPGG